MSGKSIKCVVWDLDNTIWNGILSEDNNIELKEEAIAAIKELDNRGILQSISSKNEYLPAMKKLKEFGIDKYFLYPQINWEAKSDSINKIQKLFNFGIDTIAFVDDQDFEREEVSFSIPEVLCIDAANISEILNMEEMKPKYITEDSKQRRQLYMNDIERNSDEESYKGPKEDFLKTLDMKFIIELAKEEDLKRVEELTIRTHQLNSTGTVYSYDELVELINSDNYDVFVAQLDDKYGEYGKIGISVIEKKQGSWNIKLLLMSCRVMSKGVGAVMLKYIMKSAAKENVKLYADFIPTDKNRIMYITYKFAGFKENMNENGFVRLEGDLERTGEYPDYLTIIENVPTAHIM